MDVGNGGWQIQKGAKPYERPFQYSVSGLQGKRDPTNMAAEAAKTLSHGSSPLVKVAVRAVRW